MHIVIYLWSRRQMHLKSLITGVISLVRKNRAAGRSTPVSTIKSKLAQDANEAADLNRLDVDSALTVADFGAFYELSPQAFVLPHVGAMTRSLNTHQWSAPPSSDSDPEDDDAPYSRPSKVKKDDVTLAAEGTPATVITRNGAVSGKGPTLAPSSSGSQGLKLTGASTSLADPIATVNPSSPVSIKGFHPTGGKPKASKVNTPTTASKATAVVSSTTEAPITNGDGSSLRSRLFPEVEASVESPSAPKSAAARHASIGGSSTDGDAEDGIGKTKRERVSKRKSKLAHTVTHGAERTTEGKMGKNAKSKHDGSGWEIVQDPASLFRFM